MFNTLCAQPLYNPLLLTSVDIILTSSMHLQVWHVPGSENLVADTLSHFHLDIIAVNALGIVILDFQPP